MSTPAVPERVRWIGARDPATFNLLARGRILRAAAMAIGQRGRFLLVLAGGTTPRAVYTSLRGASTDWSRWHVYFGDERCLAQADPKRNSQMAARVWLAHVPVLRDQVHPIPAELGSAEAARVYQTLLFNVGAFDLVLLGLGADGHTASLFPGHDYGGSLTSPAVLAVHDAPATPPQRVSMSAGRLSHTREACFLVAGGSKRSAVERWRRGADLPARAICPPDGVDVLIEAALLLPAVSEASA
jgi:6-phosphogluconolactonase